MYVTLLALDVPRFLMQDEHVALPGGTAAFILKNGYGIGTVGVAAGFEGDELRTRGSKGGNLRWRRGLRGRRYQISGEGYRCDGYQGNAHAADVLFDGMNRGHFMADFSTVAHLCLRISLFAWILCQPINRCPRRTYFAGSCRT
ncbi:MAG: hypothetical protein AAGC76_05495 [Luteibacter sp.]|jgi:hypothetical protein|uniref:hypothetical protein n=1 Tax=unclassified Luteibacter TaxID=2620188 RepID=UPI00280713D9|nr:MULTISPECIES: hypothetical protein [unclassified Luteibacter]MDQ7995292.1 hypothetical protein [Luteibacter sp.]MDR6644143.1 hypothetical protein [Luteibacter sp. 1214]